jgi:hypothetical protein
MPEKQEAKSRDKGLPYLPRTNLLKLDNFSVIPTKHTEMSWKELDLYTLSKRTFSWKSGDA